MEGKRLPAKALYCYVDGKMSRGRQTKRWMDNVRQDLAEKYMAWILSRTEGGGGIL